VSHSIYHGKQRCLVCKTHQARVLEGGYLTSQYIYFSSSLMQMRVSRNLLVYYLFESVLLLKEVLVFINISASL